MTAREITLHAFASAKGGVGKSTLALALAQRLAGAGRAPVVVDADLTGSSLADGLRLCAPDLPLDDGHRLALSGPPTAALLSREETLRRRYRRRALRDWQGLPPWLPFFNDALAHDPNLPEGECRLDALLWRHEDAGAIAFLPSSPLPADIDVAAAWLLEAEGSAWSARVAWLLETLARQLPELTDVVLDLPPGLFGFTHAVLSLLAHIESGRPMPADYPDLTGGAPRWRTRASMVMTTDRNDFVIACEAFLARTVHLPTLRAVVNRVTESRKVVRARVRDHFRLWMPGVGVDEKLEFVEDQEPLRSVFLNGGLPSVAALPLFDGSGDGWRS